jgi:hypothetical protein
MSDPRFHQETSSDQETSMTSTEQPAETGQYSPTGQYPQTLEDYAIDDSAPPPKARSRLPILTAALVAGLVAAAGFFAGVRVEKGRAGSSSVASTTAARRAASTGAGRSTGSSTGGAGGGFGGGAGQGAGRGRTIGQVQAVEGNDLLVTDATGNTIKVSTSSSSRITKTATAGVSDIHPGDTVVITGTQQADGTTAASAITIGGANGGGGGGFGGFGGGGSGS